jgi:hypothetical protein
MIASVHSVETLIAVHVLVCDGSIRRKCYGMHFGG